MKIIFRSAAIAALMIAAACGKDDGPSPKKEMEQKANEMEQKAEDLESTPLEADTVSDNVVIKGATKEAGAPPTPNEMISLDITGTGKTAFLNEGFDVELASDADITGAYIQFKANDGTVSNSYYNVDLVANRQSGESDKSAKGFAGKSKHSVSLSGKDDVDFTLDVDFNTTIEPGTFCYVVCVYDGNGNISAPSEVCATVESWGGNAEIVAEWDIVREEYLDGDELAVDITGEQDCMANTYSQTCGGEPTIFHDCRTTDYATLIFKEDGTYQYEDKSSFIPLDYDASIVACETVFQDRVIVDIYKSEGNWAYIKGESRLTLVEQAWSVTEDGILEESATYLPGERVLLFDNGIELSGDKMTVSDAGSYEGDVDVDYSFKTFLEKKMN